ncbi:hypothetical protein LU276_03890 [Moraxella haemolytica]|uniref:hypothetical protein n=1 Tax=Moraxella haemolytica TaxID=2904119 RepID=UPI002543EDB5|nr:hypothetical protein [Moraxella sp. ZY171148]WII95964.1 hypothetical protein LU276_03890 [Moraxella sp. ZY171148]
MKQALLAAIIIVFGFALLKGCTTLAIQAYDRQEQGYQEFINTHKEWLKANQQEDY